MVQSAPRSRPPLARILTIHRELEAHRAPNCTRLARALEVSPKTIQRDIEYMRDQMHLPIAYDAAEHAFHYTDPVIDLPFLQVTEGELLALFVSSQALASYRGTPFEQPLRAAFQKLSSGLGQAFTVDLTSLSAALSFHQTGAAETDLEVFETLSKAIQHSIEIRFRYHKLEADAPEERRVQPYHLACVNHLWYLFAHDLDRAALRRFALTRISPPFTTGLTFERPTDFSPADELLESFGIFGGTGDHRIRLAFSPFAARLIRERAWHRSQRLRDLPDGSLEMTLHLGALEEIEGWILRWGAHCRVLAPDALKSRLLDTLTTTLALYQTPDTPWPEIGTNASQFPAQLRLPIG